MAGNVRFKPAHKSIKVYYTELDGYSTHKVAGISLDVCEYHLGSGSGLDSVIGQYHTENDKRSGIASDPNIPDDEKYMVRLVGHAMRVSVEIEKIVNSLPDDYTAGEKKTGRKNARSGRLTAKLDR